MHNHAPDIAAMDLFVVPTIGFDLLYAFVIVRLDRRDVVWINVTANPTAEWVARQIRQAFPWDEAPRYLIRDRDRIYGSVFTAPIARHGHPGQALSPSIRFADFTLRIRRSATEQSCASPPVNRMAMRRPLASASAWIFVLRPPRERPTARFCSLFRSMPSDAL